MKYFLYLLCTSTFFLSCGSKKHAQSETRINDDRINLESSLIRYERIILSHNSDSLLSIMDPAYKKEQHDNMLQGRTTQFLNEFFCGQDAKSNTFKCLNYKKIKSLKLIKKERKENGYRVYYQVNSKKYSVTADWFIKIKDNKIIGLVGAVG